AVRFLERVGELGIAEAAEHEGLVDHFQQISVQRVITLGRMGTGIAPRAVLRRRVRIECDAAEFGKHDGLAAVREAVQGEDASARAALVEQRAHGVGDLVARLQLVRVAVVVMDAQDVGGRRFPAVVADHRAGRVERARQVVQRLDRVAVRLGQRQVRHAPGFVERHPYDDARVAVVALDGFGPFLDHARDRARREPVGRRHFFPHEQAQLVGPVQVARILDLLVLAHAVEAHQLGQFDVALQVLVGRCRHERLVPVALVQHEAQRIRAAVQQQAVAVDVERAQRRVRLDVVDDLVAAAQDHLGVQQRGALGAPQQLVTGIVDAGVGQRDLAVRLALQQLVVVVREQCSPCQILTSTNMSS
ncbi:conserved hypothetical protein, partial [Ricinus communis]